MSFESVDDQLVVVDASFMGVYQKHTSIDASFVLLTQQIGSSDSFSIIDASFVDIRDNLILVDASLSLLANQQGIFTSDDSENYFTDKNVNIVNTLEGYKFTVNGGVRIYDTNLPPPTIWYSKRLGSKIPVTIFILKEVRWAWVFIIQATIY